MNFSERPKAVISVSAAILLAGLWVGARLPLEWTPKIELPVVRISASWPGASPRSVERYVTAPIERAVQAVQGTVSIESISEEGRAQLILEVDEDINLALYSAEVSDQLNLLHNVMPERVRPVLTREVPQSLRDEQGFMTLQLVGPHTPEYLRRLAEKEIAPMLESFQGLENIVVLGGAERELRITFDSDRIVSLGISPIETRQRLIDAMRGKVFGRIKESGRATLLIRPAERVLEPLRNLILSDYGEPVVRLRDVATLEIASTPIYSTSRVDGQPVVTIVISRTRGSHMLAASDAVYEWIDEITLPSDVKILIVDDRSQAVREQLNDLYWRGGLGLILVTLALLFMLKSVRATLVVLYSVLVSLAAASLLLALFEMSLNLLTIAGLVLVFGLLVDNSVVVVEQIQKQCKTTNSWHEITRESLRTVWQPLLGGTLSTMAVIIPLVYLSGELRVLFLPFGLLVCITLGISLISARVLVPVLMQYEPPKDFKDLESLRFFLAPYRLAGKFPKITIFVLLLSLGMPLWLVPDTIELQEEWSIPKKRLISFYNATLGSKKGHEFMYSVEPLLGGVLYPFTQSVVFGPVWNYNVSKEVIVDIDFPTGNPFARADSLAAAFENIALASPDVFRTITQVYEQRAVVRVQFNDQSLQTDNPIIVLENLIQRVALIGGVTISVSGLLPESYYSGGGTSSGFRVIATGPNYEEMKEIKSNFADQLKNASRRVYNVDINAQQNGFSETQKSIEIPWDGESEIQSKVDGRQVASSFQLMLTNRFPFYRAEIDGEMIPVRAIYATDVSLDIDGLFEKQFSIGKNRILKLGGVSTFEIEEIPERIERVNQKYRSFMQIDYRGSYESGKQFLETQLSKMSVPAGFSLETATPSFFDEDISKKYLWAILGILFLVYVITAALFESWWLPFVVILSLPVIMIGVSLGFLWSGASFAEGAFIGSILLIGISVNDAILIIARFKQLHVQGRANKRSDNFMRALRDRIRPMWATTLTSIVAMLPLIIQAEVSDFWLGLTVIVVGGLLASTILVPVMMASLLAISWSN